MDSYPLGSDVPLQFRVKVRGQSAKISHTTGELYRGDTFLRKFTTTHVGNRVVGVIDHRSFSTVGDYTAKFNVFLTGMGKREWAIDFKITESVLGKKRQLAGSNL